MKKRQLFFDRTHIIVDKEDTLQCEICYKVVKEKKYICSLTRELFCGGCYSKTNKQSCNKEERSEKYHDHFLVLSILSADEEGETNTTR